MDPAKPEPTHRKGFVLIPVPPLTTEPVRKFTMSAEECLEQSRRNRELSERRTVAARRQAMKDAAGEKKPR